MGWLFKSKKTVPKVPFPEAQPFGSDTLRFPEKTKERVIEPEEIMDAAGLKEEMAATKPEKIDFEPKLAEEELDENLPLPEAPGPITNEPLYVKVDVYQRILGEIGNLKGHLLELNETNRALDNSEYNEEANFDALRKALKAIHDRLLEADKILFK